jgi:hypothetical protein
MKDAISAKYRRRIILVMAILIIGVVIAFFLLVNQHIGKIQKHIYEYTDNIHSIGLSIDDIIMGIAEEKEEGYLLNENHIKAIRQYEIQQRNIINEAMRFQHEERRAMISQINLYVTVGIILMTLLGIFVPVLVHHYGKAELKDDIDETKKTMINFEGDLKGYEHKFNDLSPELEKVKSEMSNIPPLRLHYSFTLAISPNNVKWFSTKPKERKELLKAIFQHIIVELKRCKQNNIYVSNNEFFKLGLRAFGTDVREILKFQTDRNGIRYMTEIIACIEEISLEDESNSEEKLNNIIQKFEVIESSI